MYSRVICDFEIEKNLEGRRGRDRPKLMWKVSILEYYQELGVGSGIEDSSFERT